MDQSYMKEQPVVPLVLSMALPMVLSMLVNSLYNIVDSHFVSLISDDAMTALSLVYPVQNLVNAVGIGFGVGISAVISLHLGANEQPEADKAASQGMFLSLIHGVVLSAACIAIMPAFLRLYTSDAAVIDLGVRYSTVVFAFGVMVSLGVGFEKVFQGVGRMKVTMVSLGAGCVANIILDPVMIFGWGPFPAMGIEGAALATGIGHTFSEAEWGGMFFTGWTLTLDASALYDAGEVSSIMVKYAWEAADAPTEYPASGTLNATAAELAESGGVLSVSDWPDWNLNIENGEAPYYPRRMTVEVYIDGENMGEYTLELAEAAE